MGLAIRCCLVAMWLALLGAHAWRYVLPGIGLVERHDLGAGLAQLVDHTLTYDIMQLGAPTAAKRLGGSELTVTRDDGGFRCDFRLDLQSLPQLPMAPSEQAIQIIACERLDDRFRLVSLTADGQVLGVPITAKADVDHRGLTGVLSCAGKEIAFALPGFNPDSGAAMDLGVTLPPGLKPGDRFKARMLDISLTPSESAVVFTAGLHETVDTRGGPLELLRVEVSAKGQLRSIYWCDASGTVYRAELTKQNIAMELVRVRLAPNQQLWPVQAAR